MKIWIEKRIWQRTLEIIPGLAAWVFILTPLMLAFVVPTWVALFILVYSLYFLVKALNIARHMIAGYFSLKRNMNINWLSQLRISGDIKTLQKILESRYQKTKKLEDYQEMLFVQNLKGRQRRLKNWEEITHVVLFAVSKERLDILIPSVEAVSQADYPNKNIMVVFAAEDAYKDTFLKDFEVLKKKYGKTFKAFKYYLHVAKEGEVKPGKGPNITTAGRLFWKEYQKKLDPQNVLVTNLDADHIVHQEYFGRLTYLYIVDPNRHQKSYQPIPLLFNNIWDVPALNRVAAVSSSFWQIVEGMRTFRLRTFAAHTQSMAMLLTTDFWSVKTIVEDGHQYWRTYFALNGDHQMVAMYIPVYQDAVLGGTWWESFKNQYLQKRRWAWGVTDFPFVVTECIRHKEISLGERLLQIFRQFSGHFTWSTSSIVLALGWIPLYFNRHFQDTVLAHNISTYSSGMLRLAWLGIILNVWISMALFPPKPKKYGLIRDISMVLQWVLAPVYALVLSSIPALESQTRLMLGKKLEFWITPKVRKNQPKFSPKSSA